jgi:hypothetical protein
MAYIGTKPTIGNFQICDAISVVNGQAAYTMQVGGVNVSPQSSNHMIVSLNGTIQKPGGANPSFTVSGSTITFASNLATGDVIDFIQILGDVLDLGVPSDATVTAAKIGANAVTAAKLNNDIISGSTELASEPADTDEFLVSDAGTLKRIDYSLIKGGGITMADQFRLSANQSGGTNGDVTSNLERVDTDGFGQLGTGLTESSGIFSFPSTGIYLISLIGFINARDDQAANISILTTTDNSSYNDACIVTAGNQDAAGIMISASGHFIFDVTNTSTHKFKLYTHSMASGSYIMGDTDRNRTAVTVIRLGDT